MNDAAIPKPPPTPMPKAVLCPYCGSITRNTQRCESCQGYLDALSRQATQNGMGPWQLRDSSRPFHPGCSFDVLLKMVRSGRVHADTIVRGPTTGQFWMLARRTPGVSHLLGWCHSCQSPAKEDEYACRSCGAVFQGERDRQHLGLGPIRPLPGEGSDEMVAAHASYALPDAPVPTPSVRRPTAPIATHNGKADHLVERAQVRVLERHIHQLRSKLNVAIGVAIAMGCAFVASVVILTLNRPEPEPLTGVRPLVQDPIMSGPGLVPFEDEPDPAASADDVDESIDEGVMVDSEPENRLIEPAPDRPFDITLLAWPDVEIHLESVIDTTSAASLEAGIELLKQYEQAVGLPERGQELLDAWTYRLEQLRLNGIP